MSNPYQRFPYLSVELSDGGREVMEPGAVEAYLDELESGDEPSLEVVWHTEQEFEEMCDL